MNTSLKVINLSEIALTPAQESFLSLGLSFSLVANFDFFITVKDVFLFAQKLLLKKHFLRGNSHYHLQHNKNWKHSGH